MPRASGAAAAVVACVLVAGFAASQRQPREVSLAAGAGSKSTSLTTFSGDSVAVPPTYVIYGKGTTFSPQAPFENSAMDKSVRTVSLAARLPQELAEMPATGSLHDEKVAQLFREEAQDAAEAAVAVAANQPSQALRYQKEASKLATKAVSAAANLNLESALPAGFHALKPGQKLPKGAVIVKQAPVRMRAGTLRHGSRKAQAKSEEGKSLLDDARADVDAVMKRAASVQHETGSGIDAVMHRAASTFKDAQGEAQRLMRRTRGVFR